MPAQQRHPCEPAAPRRRCDGPDDVLLPSTRAVDAGLWPRHREVQPIPAPLRGSRTSGTVCGGPDAAHLSPTGAAVGQLPGPTPRGAADTCTPASQPHLGDGVRLAPARVGGPKVCRHRPGARHERAAAGLAPPLPATRRRGCRRQPRSAVRRSTHHRSGSRSRSPAEGSHRPPCPARPPRAPGVPRGRPGR